MRKIDTPTDIRKVLLGNGYVPLLARDKHCKLDGWSTLDVDEKLIESWRRSKLSSTALRLDGLTMLDKDVTDAAVSKLIRERWEDHYPDLFDNADIPLLERGTTASCKVAFIFRRADGLPGVIQSVRFIRPGETPQDAQFIEVLSGSGRYAGAIGLHDEEKGSTYVWPADSPLAVPHASLPVLSEIEIDGLLNIAETIFREQGYVEVEGSKRGSYSSENVYDIEDDAVFDCEDGAQRTLEEMKQAAADGLRCSASWHDRTSTNTTRCIARVAPSGFIITDFATSLVHYEKSAAPEPLPDLSVFGFDQPNTAKLPGDLGGKSTVPPPPPGEGSAESMAAWLRAHYAFMPTSKTPIVPIRAKTLNDGAKTLTHFRTEMLPWFTTGQPGPRGGKPPKISPMDLWLRDPQRIVVTGYALRPDVKSMLFEDDGRLLINIYHPPVHGAGGDARTLIAFMEHLVPDERERKYFLQVVAHKFRHPEVPGPGVIMVANDTYGTGRGRFAKLLKALFGSFYVETVLFHMFSGSSYQSQYNAYEARNLIVVVDETQQLQGHTKRSTREDNSAVLRERMDPEARMKQIIMQGQVAYSIMVYVTYFVMTNSYDSYRMLEQERRAVVLTNGEPREAAYWAVVNASIENAADVAAFAAWLLTIDLSDFSPYAPPIMTDGKRIMIDASKSDIDRGLETVLADLKKRGGELFSMLHIINGMAAIEQVDDLDYPDFWQKIVNDEVRKRFHRIGVMDGVNWKPRFAGKRWPTYAWTPAGKKKWTHMDELAVRRELMKAGALDGQYGGQLLASFDTKADEQD